MFNSSLLASDFTELKATQLNNSSEIIALTDHFELVRKKHILNKKFVPPADRNNVVAIVGAGSINAADIYTSSLRAIYDYVKTRNPLRPLELGFSSVARAGKAFPFNGGTAARSQNEYLNAGMGTPVITGLAHEMVGIQGGQLLSKLSESILGNLLGTVRGIKPRLLTVRGGRGKSEVISDVQARYGQFFDIYVSVLSKMPGFASRPELINLDLRKSLPVRQARLALLVFISCLFECGLHPAVICNLLGGIRLEWPPKDKSRALFMFQQPFDPIYEGKTIAARRSIIVNDIGGCIYPASRYSNMHKDLLDGSAFKGAIHSLIFRLMDPETSPEAFNGVVKYVYDNSNTFLTTQSVGVASPFIGSRPDLAYANTSSYAVGLSYAAQTLLGLKSLNLSL